jgi:ribosomal protein L24E
MNNTRYRLRATAMNFGTQLDSFAVRCSLIRPNGTFINYTKKTTLGGGASATVQFANRKYVALGTWTVVSWTQLLAPGGTPVPDQNAWNDTTISTFVSVAPVPGWAVVEEMPEGDYVNAGASIAAGQGECFLIKGKRSPEVYKFGEEIDANVIATVPEENRKVGHGTGMVYLDGKLYLLKANKSFEFMSLDPASGEWTQLADVPAGPSERAPKKGASMTVVDGKIYVLKGNKTREFFVYDPAANAWTELADVPAGDMLKTVKGGGALTSLNGRIFAFKGNKTTEYYTYDITTDVWQRLADIPVRRVKDGACLTSLDGSIYATVGGNKMAFWSYDVFTNAWAEQDEVPFDMDRRKVKYGAAMAALDGYLLFIKGRKTEYVLGFVPGTGSDGADVQPEMENVMGTPGDVQPSMVMAPNPASGRVRVSYSAGNSSAASGRLYTSTGQLVREFALARGGSDLNVSELANGVYLVRVSDGNRSLTQRLVIQH